jgi:phosphoribosylpyrophosphate synthetase
MVCKRFADGELYIQIQESIRGCDVYLLQPSCHPVNDNWEHPTFVTLTLNPSPKWGEGL